MEMFAPSLDWSSELWTSLLWIGRAWVVAAVITLVILVLIVRFTTWGSQFWRVTREYFTGPESALRFQSAGGVSAMSWVDGAVAYVVSGEANRDRLQTVAQAAYDQLDARTPLNSRGS